MKKTATLQNHYTQFSDDAAELKFRIYIKDIAVRLKIRQ